MSEVISIQDQNVLVETNKFPEYAKFPFDKFNPVQSVIFEIYDQECNAVIAARTSAGKTVCAEMFISNEVRVRGGKAMYLAPLKALAKEKIDDWTDEKHHFGDLNMSICTGDYQLTPTRQKELESSDIVVMTSEMLNSRCRNFKSENNDWLKEVGTIVVDESHLLTVPSRGDHLEVGLMKLSQIAKSLRIVFLSATMPNVDEIAKWLSSVLTDKKTYLLVSEYRPCPLGIHFETYESEKYYEDNERVKINHAIQIYNDHPDDKFLFFVHTKRTGDMLKKELIKQGIECEFHNADLEKEKRHTVESRFRKGELKAIIATSTLAWGLNLPARRVVIVGVHRGMGDVDTYDIWQMAGRAGRPGYDPRGDVYILLPENTAARHVERLEAQQKIESRLLDNVGKHYKTLAFHIVSEIHHGGIKTKEDMRNWYKKSLACFQSHDLSSYVIDSTIDLLIKFGAIVEEKGEYKTTAVGKIASMFYYSPFDIADLRRNFKALFEGGYEDNDLVASICLADVDSIRMGIASKAEKEDMMSYRLKIQTLFGDSRYNDPTIKGGFAYYSLMNDVNAGSITSTARLMQMDFPRLKQVLVALDTMSSKWNKTSWFNDLQSRITYGVKSELVPLVGLPNIGKVRAEKLWEKGIRTMEDVATKKHLVKQALNMKDDKIDEICNAARGSMLVD